MTITVTKRHLWIFVKYGLLVSFFGCVVLCEGVSIPLPNAAQYKDQFPLGALAPYRSSWQYILVSTGIQVLHQRPSFPLHIGAIATLSNAAFIVTLSGVLWTGGVGAAFYPHAWSLTKNNLQAHIDLSLFIAGMTLLQLAKTIRPEAIPGEMPSSFILAKGLVGVPLFLLAVSVLGSRCRHRVMAGYTSWKEELLLLCPFLLGTLIFLAFLAGSVLIPDWGRDTPFLPYPVTLTPPEWVLIFLMAACWGGMTSLKYFCWKKRIKGTP